MPFAAELAGVLEHDHALRMFKVFVQPQAWSALAQDARQGRLARLDRLAPQIGAVQLQQVEGIEEGVRLVAAMAQDVEPGEPALIAAHHLPSIRQERTLRWFTASITSGKRSDQSLPRRVISRTPTESLRAIRR